MLESKSQIVTTCEGCIGEPVTRPFTRYWIPSRRLRLKTDKTTASFTIQVTSTTLHALDENGLMVFVTWCIQCHLLEDKKRPWIVLNSWLLEIL